MQSEMSKIVRIIFTSLSVSRASTFSPAFSDVRQVQLSGWNRVTSVCVS